jgi:putative Holliday junction resolvase
VLGRPIKMSGEPGRAARTVEEFGRRLEELVDAEVVLWDERLSTAMARSALREGGVRERRGRRVVDKLAATLILQGYLDNLNSVQLKDSHPDFDR